MKKLTFRIMERSIDGNGSLTLVRRFYSKRKRIKDVFSVERGQRWDGVTYSHHVTLFGLNELATFIFDRHEQVYVNGDDGTIYDGLHDAVYDVLKKNNLIKER